MLITHFFIGFIISYLGFTPPSMLNLTASKVLLEKDIRAAYQFIFGASLVVLAQFFLSYLLVSFVNDFSNALFWIKNIAIILFSFISIFFLTKSSTQSEVTKSELKSHKNNFVYGITLSFINMFAIPFFAITYSLLSMKGFVKSESENVFTFAFGIFLGVIAIMSSYVILMKRFKKSLIFLTKFINPVIGIITGAFAVYYFVKLYL